MLQTHQLILVQRRGRRKKVLARIDTWKSDVFDVVSPVAPDCSNYGMLGYADIGNLVQLKEIIQVIV